MRTKATADGLRPEVEEEPEDLFEMANLYPETTGLPMTVWVSPRGRARHDVRIEADMAHGERMSISDSALVTVRPAPHVIEGRLSPEDTEAVAAWIRLNTDTLVAYWQGRIDTARMVQALKALPAVP